MKKNNQLSILCLLLLSPLVASAGATDLLDASLKGSITGAMAGLQSTAILWLSSFMLIQFLITNFGLLKSGADIEAVYGKFLGSLLWFGFCFYVMAKGRIQLRSATTERLKNTSFGVSQPRHFLGLLFNKLMAW